MRHIHQCVENVTKSNVVSRLEKVLKIFITKKSHSFLNGFFCYEFFNI